MANWQGMLVSGSGPHAEARDPVVILVYPDETKTLRVRGRFTVREFLALNRNGVA